MVFWQHAEWPSFVRDRSRLALLEDRFLPSILSKMGMAALAGPWPRRHWPNHIGGQTKALLRLFREEPDGFQGGLSAANYRRITGAPASTATRDLADLVAKRARHPECLDNSSRTSATSSFGISIMVCVSSTKASSSSATACSSVWDS